ncbi:hypothetical protein OSTOST_12485 [Ostertagia ostertagi]
MPLERFLDTSLHMSFVIDDKYAVHSFSELEYLEHFKEDGSSPYSSSIRRGTHVWRDGVDVHRDGDGCASEDAAIRHCTALPTSRLATMTPTQVMAEVCEYAGQPFVTLSKLKLTDGWPMKEEAVRGGTYVWRDGVDVHRDGDGCASEDAAIRHCTALPTSRLATMTPTQVMAEVCEYAGQPFVTLSKL